MFARIIEDSITPWGKRLTTMHLRYPRMVHADFMTHRMFSRNGRSSRAVPILRLLKESIVEPIYYGTNQSGMSAGEPLTGWRYHLARLTWLGMAHMTKFGVRILHFAGLHKQWANRPLEWAGWIDVLVSATEWTNFFALRDEKGAQPEIQRLAQLMKEAMDASQPKLLYPGGWHLPYITDSERRTLTLSVQQEISVARCARISYTPFNGHGTIEAERSRYQSLMGSHPLHASPAEHQATPDEMLYEGPTSLKCRPVNPNLHGNFQEWIQYRKTIPGENILEWQRESA